MNVRLPKPLQGWNVFTWDLAIVTLGVLMALAAQQLVDDIQWRSEVGHFRAAVDYEIGRNLGVYEETMKDRPCITRRLAELERFLADSRAGRQDRLARSIGKPNSYSQDLSVWDSKGADVTEHLPRDTRVRYGEVYDAFRNDMNVRTLERDLWLSLSQFDEAEPLDRDDRMRLRELLTRGERVNAVTSGNYDYILKLAKPLGIRPIADPNLTHLAGEEHSFCERLLANN